MPHVKKDSAVSARPLARATVHLLTWITCLSVGGAASPASGQAGAPAPAARVGAVAPEALIGTVRSAEGELVAGAEVRLVGTPRRVLTGADGRFELTGLRPGEYLLEVHSDRFGHALLEVSTSPPAGGVEIGVTLHLEAHHEEVVVTASPDPRGAFAVAQPVAELSGNDLLAALRPTIGETLVALAGVHQTSFGAGASRPVIRGLGGDRIRVLEDGVGTGDASTTSPDHAVSLDPLTADEVEVVRGPATLLYGSSAVGGVVNVLTHAIPTVAPGQAFAGRATLAGASAAEGLAAALELEGGRERWAWHLDGLRREEKDYQSAAGTVGNSFVESEGGNAGISWLGAHGFAGISLGALDSRYGNPAEESVTIDLRQRRGGARAEWQAGGSAVRGVKARFGATDYEHTELEGREVGTRFLNRSAEARFDLLHGPLGPFSGALGIQGGRRDFEAVGAEAFVPPTETDSVAAFLFEEAARGPLRFQVGLRWERAEVVARPAPAGDHDHDHDEEAAAVEGHRRAGPGRPVLRWRLGVGGRDLEPGCPVVAVGLSRPIGQVAERRGALLRRPAPRHRGLRDRRSRS